MPTYQYRCTACGEELEAVQKFSDPALDHLHGVRWRPTEGLQRGRRGVQGLRFLCDRFPQVEVRPSVGFLQRVLLQDGFKVHDRFGFHPRQVQQVQGGLQGSVLREHHSRSVEKCPRGLALPIKGAWRVSFSA